MSDIVKATPVDLISKAIESNVDIEQLERLVSLQERWEEKEAKKLFFIAMNSFQSEKPDIIKDKGVSHDKGETNKFYFAPLPKIQKLVDPVLSKYGLSYSWKQENVGDFIKITCVVKHESSHCEESHIQSEKDSSGGKNSIQAISSAVSYMKRITLMNALGLSADDDDGASSQMSSSEIDSLALEKLTALRDSKKSLLEKATLDRVNEIIENEESNSYRKAIKTLEKV